MLMRSEVAARRPDGPSLSNCMRRRNDRSKAGKPPSSMLTLLNSTGRIGQLQTHALICKLQKPCSSYTHRLTARHGQLRAVSYGTGTCGKTEGATGPGPTLAAAAPGTGSTSGSPCPRCPPRSITAAGCRGAGCPAARPSPPLPPTATTALLLPLGSTAAAGRPPLLPGLPRLRERDLSLSPMVGCTSPPPQVISGALTQSRGMCTQSVTSTIDLWLCLRPDMRRMHVLIATITNRNSEVR